MFRKPARLGLVLLAAIVGVASVVPLLAVASHVDVRDPNDTKGLLDVRRVSLKGSERPTWNIITFNDWSVVEMFDAGYFLVRLDTFGKARYDYYGLVRSDGFAMRGTLVRDRRSKPDFNVGSITAWHPTRTSVKVRIPLRKMKIGGDRLTYGWRVQTLFSGCARVCIDDAPDDGGVREQIPGRGPVPTPTITITPTMTPTVTPSESPAPSP
ncbi:MAG TPA: hypothetical protein VJ927_04345 [Actinomycetota bacterium]|nr:hypothetical protein [Actinomycetota bacterium]